MVMGSIQRWMKKNLKHLWGVFYVMTENVEKNSNPGRFHMIWAVFLLYVDAAQVMRVLAQPRYGWNSRIFDMIKMLDLFQLMQEASGSLFVKAMPSGEFPSYIFFAFSTSLVCIAIFDIFYVMNIFASGHVEKMWPVKMLIILVEALVTTGFSTIFGWMLIPIRCLVGNRYVSISEHIRGIGAECTPWAVPEVLVSVPALVLICGYLWFATTSSLLSFSLNPLSRSARATSTGRVDFWYSLTQFSAAFFIYFTQYTSPIATNVVLSAAFLGVFYLHTSYLPFNNHIMNCVRGGFLLTLAWIPGGSALLLSYIYATGQDYNTIGSASPEQALMWTVLALVVLTFPAGICVVHWRRKCLYEIMVTLYGEYEAEQRATLNEAASMYNDDDWGKSQRSIGSTSIHEPSAHRLVKKSHFDTFFDKTAEESVVFSNWVECSATARTFLQRRNDMDLKFLNFILKKGMQEHPTSDSLVILHIQMLRFVFRNPLQAAAQEKIFRVGGKVPELDNQYTLYALERKLFQERACSDLGQDAVRAIDLMEFNLGMQTARTSQLAAVSSMKMFWRNLSKRNHKAHIADELMSRLETYDAAAAKAKDEYTWMLEKYSNSAQLLREWGTFCDSVLNDEKMAVEARVQAVSLEDQLQELQGNSGIEERPDMQEEGSEKGGKAPSHGASSLSEATETKRATVQRFFSKITQTILGREKVQLQQFHQRVGLFVMTLLLVETVAFVFAVVFVFSDVATLDIHMIAFISLFRSHVATCGFYQRSSMLAAWRGDKDLLVKRSQAIVDLATQVELEHWNLYQAAQGGMKNHLDSIKFSVQVPTGDRWIQDEFVYFDLIFDYVRRIRASAKTTMADFRDPQMAIGKISQAKSEVVYVQENLFRSVTEVFESLLKLYDQQLEAFISLATTLVIVISALTAVIVIIFGYYMLTGLLTTVQTVQYKLVIVALGLTLPRATAKKMYKHFQQIEFQLKSMEDEELERKDPEQMQEAYGYEGDDNGGWAQADQWEQGEQWQQEDGQWVHEDQGQGVWGEAHMPDDMQPHQDVGQPEASHAPPLSPEALHGTDEKDSQGLQGLEDPVGMANIGLLNQENLQQHIRVTGARTVSQHGSPGRFPSQPATPVPPMPYSQNHPFQPPWAAAMPPPPGYPHPNPTSAPPNWGMTPNSVPPNWGMPAPPSHPWGGNWPQPNGHSATDRGRRSAPPMPHPQMGYGPYMREPPPPSGAYPPDWALGGGGAARYPHEPAVSADLTYQQAPHADSQPPLAPHREHSPMGRSGSDGEGGQTPLRSALRSNRRRKQADARRTSRESASRRSPGAEIANLRSMISEAERGAGGQPSGVRVGGRTRTPRVGSPRVGSPRVGSPKLSHHVHFPDKSPRASPGNTAEPWLDKQDLHSPPLQGHHSLRSPLPHRPHQGPPEGMGWPGTGVGRFHPASPVPGGGRVRQPLRAEEEWEWKDPGEEHGPPDGHYASALAGTRSGAPGPPMGAGVWQDGHSPHASPIVAHGSGEDRYVWGAVEAGAGADGERGTSGGSGSSTMMDRLKGLEDDDAASPAASPRGGDADGKKSGAESHAKSTLLPPPIPRVDSSSTRHYLPSPPSVDGGQEQEAQGSQDAAGAAGLDREVKGEGLKEGRVKKKKDKEKKEGKKKKKDKGTGGEEGLKEGREKKAKDKKKEGRGEEKEGKKKKADKEADSKQASKVKGSKKKDMEKEKDTSDEQDPSTSLEQKKEKHETIAAEGDIIAVQVLPPKKLRPILRLAQDKDSKPPRGGGGGVEWDSQVASPRVPEKRLASPPPRPPGSMDALWTQNDEDSDLGSGLSALKADQIIEAGKDACEKYAKMEEDDEEEGKGDGGKDDEVKKDGGEKEEEKKDEEKIEEGKAEVPQAVEGDANNDDSKSKGGKKVPVKEVSTDEKGTKEKGSDKLLKQKSGDKLLKEKSSDKLKEKSSDPVEEPKPAKDSKYLPDWKRTDSFDSAEELEDLHISRNMETRAALQRQNTLQEMIQHKVASVDEYQVEQKRKAGFAERFFNATNLGYQEGARSLQAVVSKILPGDVATEDVKSALVQSVLDKRTWHQNFNVYACAILVLLSLSTFCAVFPVEKVATFVNSASTLNHASRRRYLVKNIVHLTREMVLDDGFSRFEKNQATAAISYYQDQFKRSDVAVRKGGVFGIRSGADDHNPLHNQIMYTSGCPWRDDPSDCSIPSLPGMGGSGGLYQIISAFMDSVRKAAINYGSPPDQWPDDWKGDAGVTDKFQNVTLDFSKLGYFDNDLKLQYVMDSFEGDVSDGLGMISDILEDEAFQSLRLGVRDNNTLYAIHITSVIVLFYFGLFRHTMTQARVEIRKARVFVMQMPFYILPPAEVEVVVDFFKREQDGHGNPDQHEDEVVSRDAAGDADDRYFADEKQEGGGGDEAGPGDDVKGAEKPEDKDNDDTKPDASSGVEAEGGNRKALGRKASVASAASADNRKKRGSATSLDACILDDEFDQFRKQMQDVEDNIQKEKERDKLAAANKAKEKLLNLRGSMRPIPSQGAPPLNSNSNTGDNQSTANAGDKVSALLSTKSLKDTSTDERSPKAPPPNSSVIEPTPPPSTQLPRMMSLAAKPDPKTPGVGEKDAAPQKTSPDGAAPPDLVRSSSITRTPSTASGSKWAALKQNVKQGKVKEQVATPSPLAGATPKLLARADTTSKQHSLSKDDSHDSDTFGAFIKQAEEQEAKKAEKATALRNLLPAGSLRSSAVTGGGAKKAGNMSPINTGK